MTMKKISGVILVAVAAAFLAASLPTIAMEKPEPAQGEAKTNQFWWPEQLNLGSLAKMTQVEPLRRTFNMSKNFNLDLPAEKRDQ
jgi:catalase-peroxidase